MEFCKEAKVTCSMSDAWCVKYQKGDYQTNRVFKSTAVTNTTLQEFEKTASNRSTILNVVTIYT